MKRIVAAVIAAVFLSSVLPAQNFRYSWERVKMGPEYESSTVFGVDSIVAAHQEQMAPLMKVVIYSKDEIKSSQPEGALSNLAADILLDAAKDYIDNDCPVMSLTNRGGIRSNFPRGAVRIYDIYSTFPFDNTVVIALMKGSDIRQILDKFASKGKFEALGGVRIEVEDGEMTKCLIGGKPLEDNALYNLVTIDFLLDGGDRFSIGKDALSVVRTGIVVRDAAVKYLEELYESGTVLENRGDGRIVVEED